MRHLKAALLTICTLALAIVFGYIFFNYTWIILVLFLIGAIGVLYDDILNDL